MNYKNKAYRMLVASLPCVQCGVHDRSQAAHSNEYRHGKGRGLKSSDAAIFPLCCVQFGQLGCHDLFDQHRLFSKTERGDAVDKFITQTVSALLISEKLEFHGEGLNSWLAHAGSTVSTEINYRAFSDEAIRLLESNQLRIVKN